VSTSAATVFLVDDEPGMLKALTRLFAAEGFTVRAFDSATAFLAAYDAGTPGCLVLDVSMPGLSGLELQQRLASNGALLPIVFLTGRADIPMSVQAMKAGAQDFLTKPVNDIDLLRAVRAALLRTAAQAELNAETALLRERHASLTPREREVMARVVTGALNKQVADAMGIGEHTVKVHRSRVMEKMGVDSLAELVRAAERLDQGKNPPSS
jgi:FixJ family two-component response regulator